MMKEQYERIQLNIAIFEADDVITTSAEQTAPDEPHDQYMMPIR